LNDILGLLDSLESIILEGKKVPFSEKVLLDEKALLQIIDKIRLSMSGNGNVARNAVDISKDIGAKQLSFDSELQKSNDETLPKTDDMEVAKQYVDKIKEGANDYADYILAHLQLLLTKMQKDMIKLEKNIESGRSFLEERQDEDTNIEEEN